MRQIVFHHIPKTGGGTLVEAFRQALGPDEVSYNSGDTLFLTTHQPSMMVEYPARLHITILREPVERLISWVRYKRSTVSEAGDKARSMSTSSFLASDDITVKHCARDRMVRQLGGNFYTDPVSMPEAFDVAMHRLERMAWVGCTETLDDDLAKLFYMLNLDLPIVDRVNVGDGPDDVDDREVLVGLNRWDLLLWEWWNHGSV